MLLKIAVGEKIWRGSGDRWRGRGGEAEEVELERVKKERERRGGIG